MRTSRPDVRDKADRRFATTQWSVVVEAADPDSPRHRECLESLCRTYWRPLYAYLRCRGCDAAEAEDQTQAFFARMLERRDLGRADRERGRFRSFILASLKNFHVNQIERKRARKRGGDRKILPFDFGSAETAYRIEPVDERTPEKIFARKWALTVLEAVTSRLRDEMSAVGKQKQFDQLCPFLTRQEGYEEAAAKLEMTEGTIRVAVHRLRKRYRDLLREEVGQTVEDPKDVDAEIRELLEALRL